MVSECHRDGDPGFLGHGLLGAASSLFRLTLAGPGIGTVGTKEVELLHLMLSFTAVKGEVVSQHFRA